MKKIKKILGLLYRDLLLFNDKLLRTVDKYRSGPKALVLLYHRVDNLSFDPLMLAISPDNFEHHLVLLKKYFNIISIPELISRLDNKSLKGDELCITFDDGYKDNLTHALRIAEKYNVPITIFVTTTILENESPFCWDYDYKNEQAYLNVDDIEILGNNPSVTIGSHTVNHPRLRDLSKEKQYSELIKSKEKLEKLLRKTVDTLAYPYGGYLDWNNNTLLSAERAKYKAAFTTIKRPVSLYSNKLKLPRINIRNISAEKVLQELLDLIK